MLHGHTAPAAPSVHHGSNPAQADAPGLLGRHLVLAWQAPDCSACYCPQQGQGSRAAHMALTWTRLLSTSLSRPMQPDLRCWEPLMHSASKCKPVDTLAEPHVSTPSTAARPTLSGVTLACSAATLRAGAGRLSRVCCECDVVQQTGHIVRS